MDYKRKYHKYKQKYLLMKRLNSVDLDYPYYNLFYELTREKFEGLVKNFTPKIVDHVPDKMKNRVIEKYMDKYVLIEENWRRNEELNNVTDYFTEQCRVKCKFAKHDSPYTFWAKHRQEFSNITNINQIRDSIYYKTKLCSNFRISVAMTILKLFSAKKWLDISAGWGDRLIAAIAHGVELYCGVDPNDCLHPGYNKIINMLVSENERKNYILINDGFETAKLPDEQFDLVFSSPPFFDLEIYSQAEGDSLVRYNSVEKWYNDFLMVALRKAYDHLAIGGNMVLYMGEGIHTNYVSRMIRELSQMMRYAGVIYYYYPDKYQPRSFYVWHKQKN